MAELTINPALSVNFTKDINITKEINITELKGNFTNLEDDYNVLKANVDSLFLIVMGIIVFLMQCGFALLEAGAVRSKNTVNILIKNMLDCLIGGLFYWAFGWGFAYGEGENGFIGTNQFFSVGLDHADYPSWFFQFVFAATTATIVSGSIAERCSMTAYFMYSILLTGFVYPVVSHWAWDSDGWLNERGYTDFAGSGVVHLTGGTCALVGAFFMGPRLGRFDNDGKPIDIPGHSVPLAGLGGFILLFGFLAFNGGSQLSISSPGDAEIVGLAIVNTIIGGSCGGLSVLLIARMTCIKDQKWSYLLTLNGALTGMVSQCAGCNIYEPWAAFVIGSLAGPVFIGVRQVMIKLKIDDPLDAVGVHAGGGILGVLLAPFFKQGSGIFWEGAFPAPWETLGINIAAVISIILWAGFWSCALFGSLKAAGMLRIDSETEFKGCDIVKHGEAAYPRDAWVEGQYALKLENGAESANNLPQIHTISNNSNAAEMPYNDPIFMSAQAGKENKGFDFELNIACNKKTDNK